MKDITLPKSVRRTITVDFADITTTSSLIPPHARAIINDSTNAIPLDALFFPFRGTFAYKRNAFTTIARVQHFGASHLAEYLQTEAITRDGWRVTEQGLLSVRLSSRAGGARFQQMLTLILLILGVLCIGVGFISPLYFIAAALLGISTVIVGIQPWYRVSLSHIQLTVERFEQPQLQVPFPPQVDRFLHYLKEHPGSKPLMKEFVAHGTPLKKGAVIPTHLTAVPIGSLIVYPEYLVFLTNTTEEPGRKMSRKRWRNAILGAVKIITLVDSIGDGINDLFEAAGGVEPDVVSDAIVDAIFTGGELTQRALEEYAEYDPDEWAHQSELARFLFNPWSLFIPLSTVRTVLTPEGFVQRIILTTAHAQFVFSQVTMPGNNITSFFQVGNGFRRILNGDWSHLSQLLRENAGKAISSSKPSAFPVPDIMIINERKR